MGQMRSHQLNFLHPCLHLPLHPMEGGHLMPVASPVAQTFSPDARRRPQRAQRPNSNRCRPSCCKPTLESGAKATAGASGNGTPVTPLIPILWVWDCRKSPLSRRGVDSSCVVRTRPSRHRRTDAVEDPDADFGCPRLLVPAGLISRQPRFGTRVAFQAQG